jgi:hypothetical protein
MDPVNQKAEQETPAPDLLLHHKETALPQEAKAPESGEATHAEEPAKAQEKPAPLMESAPATAELPTTKRAPTPVPSTPAKDRLEKEIESVLEEDLSDMYKHLPPETQKEFRIQGEKTVAAIRLLTGHAKKHARKILHLIKRWLRLIPGVNRFFLEQEAKIKTDKIVLIAEEEARRKEQHLS